MSVRTRIAASSPLVQAHLLGLVDFGACLALQQRLVYETSGRRDAPITLLLCEHDGLITVGRQGSHAHIHATERELTSRRIDVQWVNRGGGAILHTPGQLALYCIVPLERQGYCVGEYLTRLERGIFDTLSELRIHGQTRPGQHGVWGRSGQLVALGAAVKSWTTYHGAFINVAPPIERCRLVTSDFVGRSAAGSLVAERQQPVKMTSVRESLLRHVTAALGCDRFHLYSGHPLWTVLQERDCEPAARVG